MIFTPKKIWFLNKVKLRFIMREHEVMGLKDIWKIITIPQSDEWSSFENRLPTKILYIFKRPIQILNRIKD